MKLFNMLLMSVVVFLVAFLSCSKSTDPEPFDESEVVQALEEIDEILGGVILSDGFSAVTQIPEAGLESSQGTAKRLNPNLIPRLSNADSTNAVDDLLFLLLAVFSTRGTYTNDGVNWTYSETPDDEIIFIFPYADTSTGLTHTAMWRYYDMADTDSLSKISFDVTVDDVQFVGITFEMRGSVTVENQSLQPVIESVLIYGFVKSNEGIQYNLNLTLNESEMTLTLGEEGQTPLEIDLSGALDLSLAKRRLPLQISDWQLDATIVNYGQLQMSQQNFEYLFVNNLEGVYGFIKWGGAKVADLVLIGKVPYVRWNDGREVPMQDYSNFSLGEGGGAII